MQSVLAFPLGQGERGEKCVSDTPDRVEAVEMKKRIGLLRHLASNWGGDVLDENGLIRILNRNGTCPPLIWCYNANGEFATMAAGLGHDQPLIGLRSLHLVEPMGPTRFSSDAATANLYAQTLLSLPELDLEGCSVGGNCQGAGIAIHLAAKLLAADRSIHALITMEAESPVPFPGRVGHIFGARSEMYNPFLRGETPEAKWRMLFSHPMIEIIPGAHGEYFREENYEALCRAVTTIITPSAEGNALPIHPIDIAIDQVILPPSPKAGDSVPITFRSVSKVTENLAHMGEIFFYYLWISDEHGVSNRNGTGALPITIGGGEDVVHSLIDLPIESGQWQFHLFACSENAGPISWLANHAPKCSIWVEPANV